MEELGRGAFGKVCKSVVTGLPGKMTSSKPKDHSLDSHEGRIVATKVLPGSWIRNMAKRKFTLSADVSMLNWFTGVTLNRFELFNLRQQMLYCGKQHFNTPTVSRSCTSGAHFRSFFLCILMTSLSVCNCPNHKYTLIILKCRLGPPLNRLSDRRFVMNISMWT